MKSGCSIGGGKGKKGKSDDEGMPSSDGPFGLRDGPFGIIVGKKLSCYS